jgi:hypothetical protein
MKHKRPWAYPLLALAVIALQARAFGQETIIYHLDYAQAA